MSWHPVEEEAYAANQRSIVKLNDVADQSSWIGMSSDRFNYVGGITIDSSGDIYVSDTFQHRILKYASDWTFQYSFGQPGSGDGEFQEPRAIAFDSAGNFYVADTANYRIQKFKPDGTFDKSWGVKGKGTGNSR